MRAAIFIDGGYFLREVREAKVAPDYRNMADHFLAPLRKGVQTIDLLRCYFYYCAPFMSQEPTEDELKRMKTHEEFAREIEMLPRWQLRLGKLEKRWDGDKEYYEQKRVDVLLSIDLVKHATAGHISHAVLLAGDSDFIPAVQAAKEGGVTVTLWRGSYHTVHRDLLHVADEVHELDWRSFPKLAAPPSGTARPAAASGRSSSSSSAASTSAASGGRAASSSRAGTHRSSGAGKGGSKRNDTR